MLEWTKFLANTFGVDPDTQKAALIIVLCALVFYWIYTNADKHAKEEKDRLRIAYITLYAPALGLLKGRNSGRLGASKFEESFSDLLIKERAKGSRDVVTAMDGWLNGEKNEDELEYLLTEACADTAYRLRDTRSLSVSDAAGWLMDAYLNLGRAALALVLVAVSGLAFAFVMMYSSNWIRLGIVVVLTVTLLAAKQIQVNRRDRKRAAGIQRIRRAREKN